MTTIFEDPKCVIGCDLNDKKLFSGRDNIYNLPGVFNILKCKCCGLIRTSPRPTIETIGDYYPSNYGAYLGTQISRISTEKTKYRILRRLFSRFFVLNADCIPVMQPGRMLEIGCASGSYLQKMSLDGWKVVGLEPSLGPAEEARSLGYEVYHGSLESAPNFIERFDLIVGWMVLEHLHDPVLSLRKLWDYGSPDCRLVISVPNAGSFQFKFFQKHWYSLQVPTHIHHFSVSSLKEIMNAGGWNIYEIKYQRAFTDPVASIGLFLQHIGAVKVGGWLVRIATSSIIFTAITYPLGWLLATLQQSGRITVWASKRGIASE